MATVTFRELWIHDGADLADQITVEMYEPDATPEVDGEIRHYGARRRIVTTEQSSQQVRYRIIHLTREQLAWLLERRGQLLMWRDYTGRLIWGATFAVPHVDLPDRDTVVDARVTVVESTHTVAV